MFQLMTTQHICRLVCLWNKKLSTWSNTQTNAKKTLLWLDIWRCNFHFRQTQFISYTVFCI